MRSCAACFFFRRDGDTDQGDCMVSPPVPVLVQLSDDSGQLKAEFVSVRPTVGDQDFCSSFSHRAGPKNA